MKRQTSIEERWQMLELANDGLTDAQIAKRTGWSQRTVRKWRRKGQRGGRAALASQMGRPRSGAMGSFSEKLRASMYNMRRQYPGRGLDTVVAEMKDDPQWNGQPMPSRATVGRYLREQGLTRAYQRHSQLPDVQPQQASGPHEVWEMDARGHGPVPDVGIISLINLNDRGSRARLLSYPCQVGQERWQRHPNTEDYQLALRLAFLKWGLPLRLQVDRASVFHDNLSKSPFPTRLHLWLLALGVSLSFGRPHQPRDQAITERSHQLWASQVLEGQRYDSWQALYDALDQRRDFLNCRLPCASLASQPPLQAYPEAMHSGRTYRPEWEAQMLDLSRIYDYLAHGHWFRLVSKDGTISLGKQVYYVGRPFARQQVELSFDPADQHLVCRDEQGQIAVRKPLRNLTKETLMGQHVDGYSLPTFQLILPFDRDTFRVARLSETMVSRLNET